MSGRKPLAVPRDLCYLYDGGLEGFYSCVHESVYRHELPLSVQPEGEAQPTLLPQRFVDTSRLKAERVRSAILQKLTPRALELVETVFLSCLPEREHALLRFLLLAFQEGPGALLMLGHPEVAPLLKAEKHLRGEAHLLTGFVRFSDVEGRLISAIRPKNFVLPFIAGHFADRFSQETFLIYDRTHAAALIYQNRQAQIVQMEAMPEVAVSEEEAYYRGLWKQFYRTIGIAERENPRCRMTHMPKRYWAEMVEMEELLR